ncbi:hypothetical protein [Cognaticolwellia mytili]|uniref:hypothetical protein n=1 Tax=Cognaticolwellia mytili TaxID=1888913 RepID=UPI00117CDFAF|nr:hypothetical protein [Cognaticolwellia mytili]
MAKSGASFTLLALASLSLVALWIFIVSAFDESMKKQQSQRLLVLMTFMVAMTLAFFTNAITF